MSSNSWLQQRLANAAREKASLSPAKREILRHSEVYRIMSVQGEPALHEEKMNAPQETSPKVN